MKLIPGSAEQRGTDFVRALRGETPFCRCHPPVHAGRHYLQMQGSYSSLSVCCIGKSACHGAMAGGLAPSHLAKRPHVYKSNGKCIFGMQGGGAGRPGSAAGDGGRGSLTRQPRPGTHPSVQDGGAG